MIVKKRITYLPKKNMVLLIPPGLHPDETQGLLNLSPTVIRHKPDGSIKEKMGISESFTESLIPEFPDFKKLMFVKNPYWRTLEIYLRKYLYRVSYDNTITQTFKKTIEKLYGKSEIGSESENREFVLPQNLNLTENFFICENFVSELKRWFDVDINFEPRSNVGMIKKTSIYDLSMTTFSDFFDLECGEMIYEKNIEVFEKFGYDFYSYLDYHDPIRKIHVLHGNLTNKFEI